jgi:hypothetical protein
MVFRCVGLELEDNLLDWRISPKKILTFFFVDVVDSYLNGLASLWRGYLVRHNCIVGNFFATLLISSPPGLWTNSEAYNVLTLGCLSCVEPNIIVIVPLKPLVKLKFGFCIMP